MHILKRSYLQNNQASKCSLESQDAHTYDYTFVLVILLNHVNNFENRFCLLNYIFTNCLRTPQHTYVHIYMVFI